MIYAFLAIALSCKAYGAQEPSTQPVNIVLINDIDSFSSTNIAMSIHIRDGIAAVDPCFVMLFNRSHISSTMNVFQHNWHYCLHPETMNDYQHNWRYYIHPETNMVMCLPTREQRSFTELGFIQDDWKGPLKPKEIAQYPHSDNSPLIHEAITKILKNKAQQPMLNVMLCGHGGPSSRQKHCQELKLGTIANLTAQQFQDLLVTLHHMNTNFLSIDTCYGGGLNLLASVNVTHKPSFPIVVHSMGNVFTCADSSVDYSTLFDQLPQTIMCPDAHHQAIESAVRTSYTKIPYIENIPVVYIPGRKFYEPLLLDNHLMISPNCKGEITIPEKTQAIIMQSSMFHGTIFDDHYHLQLIPVISRIPGNATHYIESYSNKQLPIRSLIQSFLPTSYDRAPTCKEIKLWLINRLEASDTTFEQCALCFNGFKPNVIIAANFSGTYGMAKLPAHKKTEYSPSAIEEAKMDLSYEQYQSLLQYLCKKATIHPEVAGLLEIPATYASEIGNLFKPNETICAQAPEKNMVLAGRLIKYEYGIRKYMQQARRIQNMQATGQYHELWRAYNTLETLITGNPEIKKFWPFLAQKLMDENIIEPLLYVRSILDTEKIQEVLPNVSCTAYDCLQATSDDPFKLLFQVVQTRERQQQFEHIIDTLIKEKNYKQVLTLLTFLIPDSEVRSKDDDFLLFNSVALNQRRKDIVWSLSQNYDFRSTFIDIIKNSFNRDSSSSSSSDSMDLAQAKLLMHYLFTCYETNFLLDSFDGLEDIINGIHDNVFIEEQAYFIAYGEKLLKGPQKALFVASVIAKRLEQLNLPCPNLACQLPVDLRPLSYRLMRVQNISSTQERTALNEFKDLLKTSTDKAINISLRVIHYLVCDAVRSRESGNRFYALVNIITQQGHLETLVARIHNQVHHGWSHKEVQKIIYQIGSI